MRGLVLAAPPSLRKTSSSSGGVKAETGRGPRYGNSRSSKVQTAFCNVLGANGCFASHSRAIVSKLFALFARSARRSAAGSLPAPSAARSAVRFARAALSEVAGRCLDSTSTRGRRSHNEVATASRQLGDQKVEAPAIAQLIRALLGSCATNARFGQKIGRSQIVPVGGFCTRYCTRFEHRTRFFGPIRAERS